MSKSNSQKPTSVYWLVTLFLLIWGCAYAGLVLFSFVLATPQDWVNMVQSGRILPQYVDYIAAIPDWVIVITAVAAVTRLAGAVSLLLRKTWAVRLYGFSLLCVVIIMFRGFVLADVTSVIRTSQVGVEALFLVLSFFALWYSLRARSRNYLS